MENKVYDVIVIGAGPAGLSAAIYLLRANKSVLVLDKKEPLSKVQSLSIIDNYLGYSHAKGKELAVAMLRHYAEFKNPVYIFNCQKILKDGDNFIVTDNEEMFYGKYIIIATGLKEQEIVKDSNKYIGKGVSYCITCDGFLYKNKKVALVGNSDDLKVMAKQFSTLNVDKILVNKNNYKEIEVVGDGSKVTGIKTDGVVENCDGIFINPLYYNLDFDFDLKMNGQFISTNNCLETSQEKVYAVGDIVDKPLRQIATAISDGAIAATDIIKKL